MFKLSHPHTTKPGCKSKESYNTLSHLLALHEMMMILGFLVFLPSQLTAHSYLSWMEVDVTNAAFRRGHCCGTLVEKENTPTCLPYSMECINASLKRMRFMQPQLGRTYTAKEGKRIEIMSNIYMCSFLFKMEIIPPIQVMRI